MVVITLLFSGELVFIVRHPDICIIAFKFDVLQESVHVVGSLESASECVTVWLFVMMVSVLIEIVSCVVNEGGMSNSVLPNDTVTPCRLSWLMATYSSYCLGV